MTIEFFYGLVVAAVSLYAVYLYAAYFNMHHPEPKKSRLPFCPISEFLIIRKLALDIQKPESVSDYPKLTLRNELLGRLADPAAENLDEFLGFFDSLSKPDLQSVSYEVRDYPTPTTMRVEFKATTVSDESRIWQVWTFSNTGSGWKVANISSP